MTDLPILDWLMRWYESHCDGEWEEDGGFEITNLDNPGWSVKLPLKGTALSNRNYGRVEHNYDHETEWWTCWVEKDEFHGAGGPLQLRAMLEEFRRWAESPADS